MARHDRKAKRRDRRPSRVYKQQGISAKLIYVNSILVFHLLADRYGLYGMIEELIKNYK